MRRILAGVAVAAATALVAACGGGDEAAQEPVDAAPAEEQPVEEQPAEEQPVEEPDGDEDDPGEDSGGGDAPGVLLMCDDEAVLAATEEIRTRENLTMAYGESLEAVSNCMWGMEGDSDSLGVNIQYWTLGGDVPSQEWLETLTLERIDAPDLEARGLVVAHEGERSDTVWAFGHGFQVFVSVDRIEVTQEELVQLGVGLVEAMA